MCRPGKCSVFCSEYVLDLSLTGLAGQGAGGGSRRREQGGARGAVCRPGECSAFCSEYILDLSLTELESGF